MTRFRDIDMTSSMPSWRIKATAYVIPTFIEKVTRTVNNLLRGRDGEFYAILSYNTPPVGVKDAIPISVLVETVHPKDTSKYRNPRCLPRE